MTAPTQQTADVAREIADYHFDEHDLAEKIAAALAAFERRGAERERDAEIVRVATDLVALWTNPKIAGLPRSERNAAIEETREKLILLIKPEPLHLVTQDDQPYGSVRRCCERCGVMCWPGQDGSALRWTSDREKWAKAEDNCTKQKGS